MHFSSGLLERVYFIKAELGSEKSIKKNINNKGVQ